jgi:hypothetical protein
MSGLYSALFSMAFTSVALAAKVGVVLGLLGGGALAYVPIARVLRVQAEAPPPLAWRRLAGVCCLLWGLVLPLAFGAAGLTWGLARGLGNVVEGPVSATVRATTETWLSRANVLRAGLLARYPLTKRLTDSELMGVVRAAPVWISEALDNDRAEGAAKKMHVPPAVLAFVREEFHAWTVENGTWLRPAIERLRARAQGNAADRPTLQETIEAMVAPSVFQDAAGTIRATAGHYARTAVLSALGLSALLAGVLWAVWKRLAGAKAEAAGG